MIKPYKGICNKCKQEKWIQNSKGVCSDCVYMSNHNGKTQFEVSYDRQKQKVVKQYHIKKKVPKKRFKKATGEKIMFLEVWQEREHICKWCGVNLGDTPKAHMFSHRISKGANSKLRLDKNNIDLFCFDCHYADEFQGDEKFNKRKDINR